VPRFCYANEKEIAKCRSTNIRALANAERPGDKLAFAKYMADHKLEIAEKVRTDTEAEQKRTTLGDG